MTATGTVAWFSDRKGYGFVVTDDGRELFVHHGAVEGDGFRTLQQGQVVEFTAGDDSRGPAALNVRVVADPRAGAAASEQG